jgi:hypothetical protein
MPWNTPEKRTAHYHANRERLTQQRRDCRLRNIDWERARDRARNPARAVARSIYQKAWRLANKAYMHAKDFVYQIKANYNLELDDYLQMVLDQEGKCKCCGIYMTHEKRGKTKCHIDHDHSTGKVRGLLCADCNQKLGVLESPKFQALRSYLAIS